LAGTMELYVLWMLSELGRAVATPSPSFSKSTASDRVLDAPSIVRGGARKPLSPRGEGEGDGNIPRSENAVGEIENGEYDIMLPEVPDIDCRSLPDLARV
jgi:hypothetical protein